MTRPSKRLYPSQDPTVPHPGMVFCSGTWRTPEAVEHYLENKRINGRSRYASDHEYREYDRARNSGRLANLKRMIRMNNQLNRRDEEVLRGYPEAEA